MILRSVTPVFCLFRTRMNWRNFDLYMSVVGAGGALLASFCTWLRPRWHVTWSRAASRIDECNVIVN